MCATGRVFRKLPASGEATSSAAAPSLMLEALPAVIVPSGPKAGLSARSFVSSNFAGPSSAVISVVFPLTVISIGTISSRNRPSATAGGRGYGCGRRNRLARGG